MRRSGSGTDLLPIRPGSRDGGGSKNTMTRLPDEQPLGLVEGAGSRPTSKSGSGSRPSSSSRSGGQPNSPMLCQGALVRLPDEIGPVASDKKPATNGQRVSLGRLPEGHLDGGASSSAAGAGGGLRERMKQGLTITTAKNAEIAKRQKQAFRTIKDGETVDQYYDFGDQIHDGGPRGRVLKAFRCSDRREVVIKVRAKKPDKSGERAWREVMTQLHNMQNQAGESAHVLTILEIMEDDKCFFVVMPMCEGGELFNFLVTEAEVPESECKRIIREILKAVGHLHDNNLIHRDVKPENILFDINKNMGEESPKTVKLIDFDTCLEWTPMTPKSKQFVGTPGYIAPEALLGDPCPQSDLWSIGVICYILMTGETPWSSIETLEDGTVGSVGANRMYNSLKAAVIDWESEPWPDFPLARDLCQKLIAFEAEDRLETVNEALSHPWLSLP